MAKRPAKTATSSANVEPSSSTSTVNVEPSSSTSTARRKGANIVPKTVFPGVSEIPEPAACNAVMRKTIGETYHDDAPIENGGIFTRETPVFVEYESYVLAPGVTPTPMVGDIELLKMQFHLLQSSHQDLLALVEKLSGEIDELKARRVHPTAPKAAVEYYRLLKAGGLDVTVWPLMEEARHGFLPEAAAETHPRFKDLRSEGRRFHQVLRSGTEVPDTFLLSYGGSPYGVEVSRLDLEAIVAGSMSAPF